MNAFERVIRVLQVDVLACIKKTAWLLVASRTVRFQQDQLYRQTKDTCNFALLVTPRMNQLFATRLRGES